jgi:shikimate dehydrogenase
VAVLVHGESQLGMLSGTRLEVWGDPVAHSRSPRLHAAAYAVLGLDWTYDRRRVDEAGFDGALSGLGDAYRGLSLTMPLKGVAFDAARSLDRRARLTGAVNTLLLGADGPHGFNTDVGGMVAALREAGAPAAPVARIIGAGATATSALVSLAELGSSRVEVVARRPEAAGRLVELGAELGVTVALAPLAGGTPSPVDVTVATLPGGATLPEPVAARLADGGGLLLDVVYGHWPTPLARAWQAAGRTAVSGLGMLLHQALLQVRVFTGGDPEHPLPEEASVLAAMREALGDA